MERKLDKEDYKNFNEMEDKLLSLNSNIKYTRDFEMESKIKYDLLCDNFTKSVVDKFISENDIDLKDLIKSENYNNIYKSIRLI